MTEKIAILVDSGCDLDQDSIVKYKIKVLPLKIIYKERTYADGVDILPDMIYQRFPEEIPKTSTPNIQEVLDAVKELMEEGYEKIISICISEGLSGTYHTVCSAMKEIEETEPGKIESFVLDTKSISIGSGIFAIYAAKQLKAGKTFEEVTRNLQEQVEKVKIFYYMDTLDYLKAGGRIGKVTGVIGSMLGVKPIISCNEEGRYYTVAMLRGKKKGIRKLMDCVIEQKKGQSPWIAIAHGAAPESVKQVKEALSNHIPDAYVIMEKQITASMAVHTGPGLVGICIFNQ